MFQLSAPPHPGDEFKGSSTREGSTLREGSPFFDGSSSFERLAGFPTFFPTSLPEETFKVPSNKLARTNLPEETFESSSNKRARSMKPETLGLW
jgi:hypothetical protein